MLIFMGKVVVSRNGMSQLDFATITTPTTTTAASTTTATSTTTNTTTTTASYFSVRNFATDIRVRLPAV